jgi:endoglucanase
VTVGLGHDCGDARCTATPPGNGDTPADFGGVSSSLEFQPGEASKTFTVPIVDHGFSTIDKTFQVAIFNAWNQGIADRSKAVVTILEDDASAPRDPNNPLGLATAPTNGDPLSGAPLFVDHDSSAAIAARTHPLISTIANQPGTTRFGAFSGSDVGLAVSRFLTRASAQEPGTVPLLATYRLQDSHCGNWTPPPADVASYHGFIDRFAQGIGNHPAVLFLEIDSLITTPCLTPAGLNIRLAELHDAINALTSNCPHLVIYTDAGAGDAIPAAQTASMLQRAGVSQIQGFFLNSTHFDWTSKEIAFGEQVSRLTGGKHFVVNTDVNGQGPLVPADRVHHGNEVLCNPPGRGLGPKPTANTGFANVDGFEWTTNPGESGGACVPGAPPTGAYWPAYAEMLVRNANFSVDNHVAVGSTARAASAKPAKPKKRAPAKKHKRKKKATHKHVKRTTAKRRAP